MKDENFGNFPTLMSAFGAYISLVSIESYVSITAGLVAIVSGIFAIRYYYIKSKK